MAFAVAPSDALVAALDVMDAPRPERYQHHGDG